MLACKPTKTPLPSKLVISNEATEKDTVLDNITDYQKLMGKLIYLTNTRLDISYDVHCLSQFMHSPLKSHLKTAFHILRYLKGCPGLGIHIVKDSVMLAAMGSRCGRAEEDNNKWVMLDEERIKERGDPDRVTRISKLDISDPLHLHPNDTTALTVVLIKLKEIENYQVWSCAMLLALEEKNKTGFIVGTCKRSNTDEIHSKQWDRVNAIVLETYDKVDGSIMFGLHHQINTLKQNGSSIVDYYHKLNALWKQYDAMIELPKCVCNASESFKKHNQLLKLMQFLMGLDDSYMQIRSSILSRVVLPDVRSAYATISSEESHKVAAGSIAGSSKRNQASAFIGPRPNNMNNNRQGGGLGLVCENCGFNGHAIDRCFKIIGYPADFGKKKSNQSFKGKNISNNNSVGTSSSSGFTDDQMVTLISLIKEKKLEKICRPIWQHDWHYRLGHPAEPLMNVLKDYLQIDKKDNVVGCEIYQRAKQTREPFPLSDHISKCLGDLIHLDLWGPYKVATFEGFRYFLTVVDDYTRAVWVYLIKSKDEIPYVSGGIPLKFWTECILTATYLINRLPSSVLNGKSPYEMIYIKCPTPAHLRMFGCLCFATIVNNNDKFSSEKYVMIGYSNVKKGYRLCSLDKHQFIFSRDVKLFENIFPFKDSEIEKNDSTNVFQDVNHIKKIDIEYHEIPNDDERVDSDPNRDKRSQSDSISSSVSGSNHNTADFPVDNPGNDADSNDEFVATQNEGVATLEENVFSEVKYGLEKYVGYSKLNSEIFCFVTQLNKSIEPKSYFEASKYPHWTDAINQEMDALLRNGTWEIVELPEGRKAIGSKWIYKIKFRSSGDFSPVVKMVTVRCLLKVVVSMSWSVFQLDVNNIFLYGDLEETVYMKPPEGYFPSGNKVCRLKKSLYRLKQAPRQWNAKLTSTLIENGFSQSKFDYSLYTKYAKGVFLALLVYVDDIIITSNNVSEIEKFKVYLKSKFMIKDLGKLKKYVLDLLSEYGMLACKPAKTPLPSKLVISNEATEKDTVLDNITDYQKLMGKLIYLTNTRLDISYDVHCLSQFMHSPLKSHLKTAFHILRYLKGCPGLGIHIVKDSGMSLTAFFDADWAKCVVTRKSVTGYCVFLNNSLVSWKSKKQKTLSKSSTEAEYRALASVTSEVIWVLKILEDLNIENLLPVKLHCDSNSAIKIAANPIFHERTKHLEIDLHFVREKILKGVVETVKVDSANQIADILTKGLDTFQHKELVKSLGLFDIYQVEIKRGC
ncbi:ribonuclease H-like domain-containing protein [Tanacetum coccineum]